MKNTMIKKIAKAVIAFAIIGATIVGAGASTTVTAKADALDYTLNHKADSKAPDVEISAVRHLIGMSGSLKADQIKEGKYYIVMKPGRSKLPTFKFRLAKVLRVREEKTWYGWTYKVVDVRYCDTGAKVTIDPDSGLKPAHFYEIDDYVVKK